MSQYSCLECDKIFASRGNLNKHKRVKHKIQQIEATEYDKDVYNIKCLEEDCNVSFKYTMDLRKHLESKHGIKNEIVEETFDSYEEFKVWLKTEENNNKLKYKRNTGKSVHKVFNMERLYFNCVIPGKPKAEGSCKTNRSCTSQIVLTKDGVGECLATYYKCHYGHDIQHIRISKATKDEITPTLIIGDDFENIFKSIKEELNTDDPLQQEDVRNFQNSLEIVKKQIQSIAFVLIDNVQTKDYNIKQLHLILENLKAAESIECSSIENHESEINSEYNFPNDVKVEITEELTEIEN